MFRSRFKGLSLYFLYQQGNLIRIKTGLDTCLIRIQTLGNGPNTVSWSTVSKTELSEFFGAHRVPGSELSEFLSAYYLCGKANSPSFSQNSPSLPLNSVSSLLRNSTLETVFRPFPKPVPPCNDTPPYDHSK